MQLLCCIIVSLLYCTTDCIWLVVHCIDIGLDSSTCFSRKQLAMLLFPIEHWAAVNMQEAACQPSH